jgi:hypothetical protein
MRPLLHWKYSGVFIPLFFATGIAMALANKFLMAHVFFLLFGLWSVASWLTSDGLARKRKALTKGAVRGNTGVLRAESRKYCAYKSGVSLLLAILTGGLMWWTVSTKRCSTAVHH